jgi:hypothetical protein
MDIPPKGKSEILGKMPRPNKVHGPVTAPRIASIAKVRAGHNGGPALEEKPHVPEWGKGGIGDYFLWRTAHRAVWKAPPLDTVLRRQEKAEQLGLTYEEYTLEILERGKYLQHEDAERIAAIKAGRRLKRRRNRV